MDKHFIYLILDRLKSQLPRFLRDMDKADGVEDGVVDYAKAKAFVDQKFARLKLIAPTVIFEKPPRVFPDEPDEEYNKRCQETRQEVEKKQEEVTVTHLTQSSLKMIGNTLLKALEKEKFKIPGEAEIEKLLQQEYESNSEPTPKHIATQLAKKCTVVR